MDVHSPKNGINRYWSIAKWLSTLMDQHLPSAGSAVARAEHINTAAMRKTDPKVDFFET